MTELTTKPKGGVRRDLSATALYTAQAWVWGGFDSAELFETPESRAVFKLTNAVMGLARMVRGDLKSLPHSLVQRHVMIDHLLKASGATQVLDLAAGFAPRGVALTRDARWRYVEMDLPAIVERKKALLAATEPGRAAAARANLRIAAGDVREAPFEPLVDVNRPVFVIAEGLLMYLKAAEQRALWTKVARLVARTAGSELVFDLTPACEQPRPGVIGRALEWLMKRFTGKAFETDTRTREDIVRELAACGFSSVETFEPQEVGGAWRLPALDQRTQVLLFRCRAR